MQEYEVDTPYIEPKKQREVWINKYGDHYGMPYDSEAEAKKFAINDRAKQIKFREVIE